MKKININYADRNFIDAQWLNSLSAKNVGFDESISCRYADLDPEFIFKNINILNQDRGGGYWIWKCNILKKALQLISDGDLLAYCDSGSLYVSKIDPLVEIIQKDELGVISFELQGFTEKMYSKRDLLIHMNMDSEEYWNMNQVCGGYIWLIKNEFTIKLIDEFCEICQNHHLLDDSISDAGEHPEFREHRHDQSIWSLLCKKYKIKPHRFIDSELDLKKYPQDNYPALSKSFRGSKNGFMPGYTLKR